MKQIDQILGQRLKRERAMAGLTQGELGKKLGISPQQVQKYETGLNRVSVSRLLEIADILHCDTKELLSGLKQKHRGKKHEPEPPDSHEMIEKLLARLKHSADRKLILTLMKRLAN